MDKMTKTYVRRVDAYAAEGDGRHTMTRLRRQMMRNERGRAFLAENDDAIHALGVRCVEYAAAYIRAVEERRVAPGTGCLARTIDGRYVLPRAEALLHAIIAAIATPPRPVTI